MTTLAVLAHDFAVFNQGVAAARIDYRRYPNTACIYQDCDRLAPDGYMCTHHKKMRTRIAHGWQEAPADYEEI